MSASGLRPVVVVAEPRTGTNLLRTMADQSGAYRLAFEFLLPPNDPVCGEQVFGGRIHAAPDIRCPKCGTS